MAQVLNKNFENLRSIFEEVLKMKNGSGEREYPDELTDKRKYASLLFVLIKKINRMVKYSLREGREELHREKLQVDSNRLHLQNLLYEVNHLKREIRNCHKFKSQDEDIDLLPDEEYGAEFLNDISSSSGHSKHLARLERELNLRKQLSAQCKDLLNSKKQVFQDIVLKMERLTSFAPSLRTLLKATRPLQDALQVPMDRDWKLQQLVQLLPQPLYLAYMNIHALEQSKDCDVCVAVIGTEEDVHQLEMAAQASELMKSAASSDTEEAADTNTKKRTKSYSANAVVLDVQQEQRKRVLEPHPLVLSFTVGNAKNADDCINVKLHYFQRMGFVAAATALNLSDDGGAVGEAALSHHILKHLYEDDLGDSLPNSGAEYELKNIKMTPEECLEYLSVKEYGKPYRWLQRMCCISVYNEAPEQQKKDEATKLQKIIPEMIKRIQHLWSSRLNLIKQIRALVNKNTDLYVREEQLPVTKPACSLVQWTSVTWEEYQSANSTATYIQANLVNANHVLYRAVVVRGSAKMECLVSISSKFPTDNPLWIICVYWNGQQDAVNSSAIKAMEYWTNSLTQAQVVHPLALLATQLARTMYSFDVFLETEGPLYNPVEYSKEKHYIKAFSKRIRARPYRYIEGGTVNSFKQ